MLKLASSYQSAPTPETYKVSSARLTTNQTVLSLCWLNGRFRALAVHRGLIEGAWECPESAEDIASFPSLLREAISHTGYKGTTVCMVLAHSRLGHQYLEAPPSASGNVVQFLARQVGAAFALGGHSEMQPALQRYTQRQVQNLKTFDGEAAWCSQPTVPAKGANGLLLHLFPKNLVSILVQGTQSAGLFLTALVPTTAVLQAQLQKLPIGGDEIALLAAETGGTTTVVVGRKEGPLFLARTLAGNWEDTTGRFAVDLKRTLLFVNQQFGVAVGSAWLFGIGAAERVADIQAQLEVPTHVSPTEYHDLFWAREAAILPLDQSPNFISRELQEAPQRRLWLKIAATATLLLVLASLLITGFVEGLIREERRNLAELERRASELQARHKALQQRHAELLRKHQLVELVHDGYSQPVAGWLLGYLSETVPPELVVTNFHVRREKNLWNIELAGGPQPNTNQTAYAQFTNAVSLLTNRLATGPFHVRFRETADTVTSVTNQHSTGSPSFAEWVARVSTAAALPEKTTHFRLEGVMQ